MTGPADIPAAVLAIGLATGLAAGPPNSLAAVSYASAWMGDQRRPAGVPARLRMSDEPGGPHGAGFQDGRTVGVRLENSTVVLSGNGRGATGDGYRIKRPCWYEPGKGAQDMLRTQERLRPWWFHTHPGGGEDGYQAYIKQFKDKVGEPGRWWTPAYNAADPDGLSCWTGLRGAVWVPRGATPPAGITATELLQIARAALTVPEPRIRLNPAGTSYVNLPTWVWLAGTGPTTRSVTATLPGIMSATVTARLWKIRIGSGTAQDRAEVRENCGPTGRPYARGARFTCGVRYLRASGDQPRRVYTMTVRSVWRVTGAADRGAGASFAYDPVVATTSKDVSVGEVHSVVRRR